MKRRHHSESDKEHERNSRSSDHSLLDADNEKEYEEHEENGDSTIADKMREIEFDTLGLIEYSGDNHIRGDYSALSEVFDGRFPLADEIDDGASFLFYDS